MTRSANDCSARPSHRRKTGRLWCEKREQEIQASLFDGLSDELTLSDVKHDYHVVRTADERQALLRKLAAQREICFDTETTGLDPHCAPLGIAFCFETHEAYYVACPQEPGQAQAVLDEFRPIFENPQIAKMGHNLKYDLSLLKWHGIEVRGTLFDTMLAHSMKEPEMRHGLDYLSKLYLNYNPISITDLIGERGRIRRTCVTSL
ncbi:MAG: hypothetical protein R3C56_15715 [Pirellulaceae bacterium]